MRIYLTFIILILSNALWAEVPVKKTTTPNGIKIIYLENKESDWVAINFAFRGAGKTADPVGQPGIGNLAMQLLFFDQEFGLQRTAERQRLADLGVSDSFAYELGEDHATFSLKSPSENISDVMAILSKYFTKPDFRGLKTEHGGSFKSYLAERTIMSRMYPDHPYGEDNLKHNPRYTAQQTDVLKSFRQRFAQDNLVIVAVGNFDIKQLAQLIDQSFKELPKQASIQSVPQVKPKIKPGVVTLEKKIAQSAVRFAHPGLADHHPDFYKLALINDILGGQISTSRLWQQIREKKGMVYHIQTYLYNLENTHVLIGEFETTNSMVEPVIKQIKEQWQYLYDRGVTRDEFEDAKQGLIGRIALNFTDSPAIANLLTMYELRNLPVDYINTRNKKIEQISYESLNEAVKKYILPEQLMFVVVGDPGQAAG